VGILRDNNIAHKILIYDMAKFYEARNVTESLSKTTASGVCNYPNIKTPAHFHLGSMGGFFTLLEMENILDSMALLYPNLVKPKSAISPTLSYEGRSIWYVKFSDNPNVDEAENEILYTSLHHAREAASLSQLIFYMWYLLENYATDPDIQATLNNSELFFVPCVNPDGYYFNQTTDPNGGGMWRRNRRLNADFTYGVDLNRNYGMNWGYDNLGSSPNTSSDTYRGTAAFSEPETQAMQAFCNSRQFKNALNAHTFSNVLIYPWGHIPSIYTPDSATYVHWGTLLTRDTRFLYGTCDQTLNYIANGTSDDWMYGEQLSKPKIFAMTPESGTYNDGFWPATNRIIDICKTTFTQNYNLARLAGSYAKIYDNHDNFVNGNGFIKYKLRKLGLSGGSFTVSLIPVGTGIASVGVPKSHNSLAQNQLISDSIAYTINSTLNSGQQIKYILAVNDGSITRYDTIIKIYGTPVISFSDNGNSVTTNYDMVGTWGLSTTDFVSPPSSITDSPGSDYGADDHKKITTKNQINLQNAIYAHLQFYTKFDIEKTFDAAQIYVSTNNGASYSYLCGKYETSPASFGGTYPVYDGRQDEWVKEEIDLSAYLGQNIKIRIALDADFYTEKDGFYFDNMLIRKLVTNPVGIRENVFLSEDVILSPNPGEGKFNVYNPNQREILLSVYNSMGQLILNQNDLGELNTVVDLSDFSSGIYFIKLRSGNDEITKKLVLQK
jgi:carboxypeptidase T